MLRSLWRPEFLALTCVLGACSREADPGDWVASTDTIDGVIVVRTLSGSAWKSPASLEKEVEIGVAEGDEVYILGEIGGIAADSAGTLFLIDTQARAMRSYDSAGLFLNRFGAIGQGPGEYLRPDGGIAVLRDGRVLLRDPGNARINVYAPDARPLTEWKLPLGGAFQSSRKLLTDTANNVYTTIVLEFTPDVYNWQYALVRFTPDGILADTIIAPHWKFDEALVHGSTDRLSWASRVPFSPTSSWTWSPHGYFVGGLATDYRIELHRTAQLPLNIERIWQPVPVSHAEQLDAREQTIQEMRRMIPHWNWNGPALANVKPPFHKVFAGEDGRIWVAVAQQGQQIEQPVAETNDEQRAQQNQEPDPPKFREPVAFDVFQPDGHYLGRVNAPPEFSITPDPIFQHETVWAVTRDELGIQRVARYRIRHSSF